jgi:hypothetical protein
MSKLRKITEKQYYKNIENAIDYGVQLGRQDYEEEMKKDKFKLQKIFGIIIGWLILIAVTFGLIALITKIVRYLL